MRGVGNLLLPYSQAHSLTGPLPYSQAHTLTGPLPYSQAHTLTHMPTPLLTCPLPYSQVHGSLTHRPTDPLLTGPRIHYSQVHGSTGEVDKAGSGAGGHDSCQGCAADDTLRQGPGGQWGRGGWGVAQAACLSVAHLGRLPSLNYSGCGGYVASIPLQS